MLLYSRADTWLGLAMSREADRPVHSLGRILRLALRGLSQTVRGSRKKELSKGRLATSVVPMVVLGLLGAFAAENARAAQVAPGAMSPVASAASAQGAGAFDDVFTLADVGARDAIQLRGVDASASVRFAVPRNRVVRMATLKLRYHFSPGLLPGISHLNVSLNGTLFTTVAVNPPTGPAGQSAMLESTLTVPAELLTQDNQLRFEFIGHYAQQCEDPANSTLWAQVDPSSAIELTGTLEAPANDLNVLPLPFRESGTNPRPVVPIVFPARPSAKAMQAAGVIASWLGVLDGARPVRFAVSFGTIPAGNAIVIAENAAEIPASLGVGTISGATVAMARNPSDPYSSVLVVAGGDADELLTAAMSLPLHGETWEGPRMSVRDLTLPPPRNPDDAPRWLSEEASFDEMAQSGDLQGDGSVPLNVTMQVPPDLFYGEKQNLPFHLSYRYNGIPLGSDSTLQVYMNGAFVSSTPMPHTENASSVLETVVPIPVSDMRPFANTMTLKFAFQPAAREHCEEAAPMNLQGAVLGDSRLDITDVSHLTTLPNLQLFANAGYPFTRMADLAETAVVLPDQPTSAELEMFLAMMGHFGAQTGYPALHVTVTNAAGMARDGMRDYLVMGLATDQPALSMLSDALPVGVNGGGLQIHDTRGFFDRAAWWRGVGADHVSAGDLATEAGLPDALMEGIEWPAGSGRSVVVVAVRDEAAIPNFVSAFLGTAAGSGIAKSVSVLHGADFSSYRLGSSAYRVGDITPLMRVTILFQEYPWLIAIVAAVFCFLIAVMMRAKLRRRARERLQGSE